MNKIICILLLILITFGCTENVKSEKIEPVEIVKMESLETIDIETSIYSIGRAKKCIQHPSIEIRNKGIDIYKLVYDVEVLKNDEIIECESNVVCLSGYDWVTSITENETVKCKLMVTLYKEDYEFAPGEYKLKVIVRKGKSSERISIAEKEFEIR